MPSGPPPGLRGLRPRHSYTHMTAGFSRRRTRPKYCRVHTERGGRGCWVASGGALSPTVAGLRVRVVAVRYPGRRTRERDVGNSTVGRVNISRTRVL